MQKVQANNENLCSAPARANPDVNAVRAFTSPGKALVTAWPSFENPRDTAKKMGRPCAMVALDGEAAHRHREADRGIEGRRPGVLLQPEQPDGTVHGEDRPWPTSSSRSARPRPTR
jgi:histidinol-phosphate/aromatic aminotransferase/cobyric acid decarboxylase-like protein